VAHLIVDSRASFIRNPVILAVRLINFLYFFACAALQLLRPDRPLTLSSKSSHISIEEKRLIRRNGSSQAMKSMSYMFPVLTEQSTPSTEALSTSRQTNGSLDQPHFNNSRGGKFTIGEKEVESGHKAAGKALEKPINQSQYRGAVAEDDQLMADEKTSLLEGNEIEKHGATTRLGRPSIFKRLAAGIVAVVKAIVTAILSPGVFMLESFRDEKRHFSLLLPLRKAGRAFRWPQKRRSPQAVTIPTRDPGQDRTTKEALRRRSSEPESEERPSLDTRPALSSRRSSRAQSNQDSPSRHTRSKSAPTTAETREPTTPRRSIRISVLNEDSLLQRRRERQKRNSVDADSKEHLSSNTPLTAKSVKSPTSPASLFGLTKYPRAPAPPRPLVPKRQPSYTFSNPPSSNGPRKTLIIDLDETLIHSMSKGGRMSTGHMVEVKLQTPVGVDGMNLGPQVPILYYVHKRPHCDEFLRKVSANHNLKFLFDEL